MFTNTLIHCTNIFSSMLTNIWHYVHCQWTTFFLLNYDLQVLLVDYVDHELYLISEHFTNTFITFVLTFNNSNTLYNSKFFCDEMTNIIEYSCQISRETQMNKKWNEVGKIYSKTLIIFCKIMWRRRHTKILSTRRGCLCAKRGCRVNAGARYPGNRRRTWGEEHRPGKPQRWGFVRISPWRYEKAYSISNCILKISLREDIKQGDRLTFHYGGNGFS